MTLTAKVFNLTERSDTLIKLLDEMFTPAVEPGFQQSLRACVLGWVPGMPLASQG